MHDSRDEERQYEGPTVWGVRGLESRIEESDEGTVASRMLKSVDVR
ncbi:hypothetical protein BIFDEN_00417 [Bifidobacterium dentium ATCC 27678]|nr:hypothetical protein BIFDEN_00417 [Bifidobacterium dentium ATCC 27678]